MRKVLMISGLALAVAGCAAQQAEPTRIQVQDLSMSRERSPAAHYVVERGDTLYGIAWRHNMDYRDLARINRIGPPYQIQPGQRLALSAEATPGEAPSVAAVESAGVVATPLGGGEVTPASGDLEWLLPDDPAPEAPSDVAAQRLDDEVPGPIYDFDSPGADGSLAEREAARESTETPAVAAAEAPAESAVAASREVAAAEPQPTPEARDAGTAVAGVSAAPERGARTYSPVAEVPWRWPADGEIIARFGESGSITAGIDIAGEKGQPVRAAGPGIVVYAGSGVRGYGNLILIKHNDQYLSAYAHNDTLRVRENDVVEAGEVIATMGDSDAESVRLHFEVRKDGQPQDPLEYLPAR